MTPTEIPIIVRLLLLLALTPVLPADGSVGTAVGTYDDGNVVGDVGESVDFVGETVGADEVGAYVGSSDGDVVGVVGD